MYTKVHFSIIDTCVVMSYLYREQKHLEDQLRGKLSNFPLIIQNSQIDTIMNFDGISCIPFCIDQIPMVRVICAPSFILESLIHAFKPVACTDNSKIWKIGDYSKCTRWRYDKFWSNLLQYICIDHIPIYIECVHKIPF